MSDSFLFYDLETFGADPRRTRIAQFAAIRTDAALEEIDAPIDLFVQPADDLLPSPVATLITGITPQQARAVGVPEADAFARIHEEMARPKTCTLGYNSLRFDDEFVRLARSVYFENDERARIKKGAITGLQGQALGVEHAGGGDVQDDVGAAVLRHREALRGDVGDGDVAGAGVAGHGRGHLADRAGAGDQHVLAHHVEFQRAVRGIAVGVEERRQFARDLVGNRPQVGRRHHHVFGERAVAGDADADGVRAQVLAAATALPMRVMLAAVSTVIPQASSWHLSNSRLIGRSSTTSARLLVTRTDVRSALRPE